MQPTEVWLTPASRAERFSCILVLCADVRKCRDTGPPGVKPLSLHGEGVRNLGHLLALVVVPDLLVLLALLHLVLHPVGDVVRVDDNEPVVVALLLLHDLAARPHALGGDLGTLGAFPHGLELAEGDLVGDPHAAVPGRHRARTQLPRRRAQLPGPRRAHHHPGRPHFRSVMVPVLLLSVKAIFFLGVSASAASYLGLGRICSLHSDGDGVEEGVGNHPLVDDIHSRTGGQETRFQCTGLGQVNETQV